MLETNSFLTWCEKENIKVLEARKNSYGIQFLVSDGKENAFIQFYHKGTFLIQGKHSLLLERLQKKYPKAKIPEKYPTTEIPVLCTQDRIGMDEAGKGDYFGPLVVACAYVKQKEDMDLKKAGIKDSKQISDKRILEIYREYQHKIPHEILLLMPQEYNNKYMEFCNLNQMLAWAHAQALENLLERIPATVAIADQFSRPQVLEKKLLDKGKKIQLIQKTGAESDTSVATASIFARAAFLDAMESLEKQYNIVLPKGANKVEYAAIEFIQQFGKAQLGNIAKLHFRNTSQLLKWH